MQVKNDQPEEVQSVLESDSMDNVQKLPTDCDDIIKRSSQSVRDSSKEELYSLLINWILIDDDEKVFFISDKILMYKVYILHLFGNIDDNLSTLLMNSYFH